MNRFTIDLESGSAVFDRGHIERFLYLERVKSGRMSSRIEERKIDKTVWDDAISYNEMNNLQRNVVEVMRDMLAIDHYVPRSPAFYIMNVEAPLLRYLNSEISVSKIEISELNEVVFLPPGPIPSSVLELA